MTIFVSKIQSLRLVIQIRLLFLHEYLFAPKEIISRKCSNDFCQNNAKGGYNVGEANQKKSTDWNYMVSVS